MKGKNSNFSLEYEINGKKHEYHNLSRTMMLNMVHRLCRAGVDYKIRKEGEKDNENH